MTRSIDDTLADARSRIRRFDPLQARDAMSGGALLVDIRPVWQRAGFGATDHDVEVIVACQEGYSSSLAAAELIDLGLHKSADLAGGFRAWQEAGLPTAPGPGVDYRGEDLAPPQDHLGSAT